MRALGHIAFLAAGCLAVVALAYKLDARTCTDTLRQWDRLQESLMDCREDPDCYITPADLERVRELAPRVQACEGRAEE